MLVGLADVLLQGALHPVLNVAHFDLAGMPADGEVAQGWSQNKVVLGQFCRRMKMQQRP